MKAIYRDAIIKAGEVRKKLKVDMFQPINIYDSCKSLGVTVRFVDVNMEGLYIDNGENATILISNQRPFPRRAFTCGHELGHLEFKHGFKLDILSEENNSEEIKGDEEILVDAFSAALLLPVGGIQVEFINRGWEISRSSPIQFYTISSIFGVGYQTLVTHCKVNELINETQATSLLKQIPSKIISSYYGRDDLKSYLRIIDNNYEQPLVDLESSNYIVLPKDFVTEPEYLEEITTKEDTKIHKAIKAGITTSHKSDGSKGIFIRIQKENYIGLAEYRHLED